MFKHFCIGALALLLAACGALKGRHPAPQTLRQSAPGLQAPQQGKAYKIDGNRSELRILVYRAGPLARLGHNHVIVNRSIGGTVNLGASGVSAFSLDVPAAGFVVDDAQARRDEGSDFAGEISDDAKSGTLLNMLSAALLDADEFAAITVHGAAGAGTQDDSGPVRLIATVAISIAGHESKIDVPFVLERGPDRLSAAGSVNLRQSALGLTPYSLMLGALQVQDAMTIKFRITAIASLSSQSRFLGH